MRAASRHTACRAPASVYLVNCEWLGAGGPRLHVGNRRIIQTISSYMYAQAGGRTNALTGERTDREVSREWGNKGRTRNRFFRSCFHRPSRRHWGRANKLKSLGLCRRSVRQSPGERTSRWTRATLRWSTGPLFARSFVSLLHSSHSQFWRRSAGKSSSERPLSHRCRLYGCPFPAGALVPARSLARSIALSLPFSLLHELRDALARQGLLRRLLLLLGRLRVGGRFQKFL